MDFRKTETGHGGSEASLDHTAAGFVPSATGLPRCASEALADPIVKALMAADRVDQQALEGLLRRTAARLALRDPQDKSAQPARRKNPTASRGLAKGFVLALAVIAGLSAGPRPATAEEAPAAFIHALGTQAVAVIHSGLPFASKATYFGQIVRQDFDVKGICRFVLGPHWRTASPAERRGFCKDFAERLVDFYGRRLAQSGDGEFVVTGSRTVPAGVIVSSRIIPQQGSPITVDWRLGIKDGVYKIKDVAIDGVSMALAQRSETAALMARGGGQAGMLPATMR